MIDSFDHASSGLQIEHVTEAAFRKFARQHGSSPEIGPIGTYLDADHGDRVYGEPHLFAMFGCGDICAVACCNLVVHRLGEGHVCKLDSIIVHQSIRRGGLGATLVNKAFQEMMDDKRFDITSFFSYAVHPATVRLLRPFGFSEPPPTGAPLLSLKISDANREQLATELKVRFQDAEQKLKLQCIYCRKHDKRARPWCVHRKH
ncbi:MAG: GNAT family N-acetyltransferase [Proteobacteria bacterium]|nr:GNAT family N-acetyltransferase [Pseudomonadota bacterium]